MMETVLTEFRQHHLDQLRTGRQSGTMLGALIRQLSKPLPEITRADVRNWMLAHKDTPASANRTLSIFKTFCDWAIEWSEEPNRPRCLPAGWVNPCLGVRRWKETKRDRVLTDGEMHRLLTALQAESARIRAYFLVLLSTGCRAGEALEMQWSSLAQDNLLVGGRALPAFRWQIQRTKNGRPHTLYLVGLARDAVATLPVHGNYLFSGSGERPYHHSRIGQWWERIRAVADLRDVRIHDLRHCAATYLASLSVPINIIGAVLNHRDVSTTQRYIAQAAYQQPMIQALAQLAERVDRAG